MEELIVHGHTREYRLGEEAILNNKGIFQGHKVMIMGGLQKGKYHPYNNYYQVRLYAGNNIFPYDFKVLEYDLM